jgi:hypothetical protein
MNIIGIPLRKPNFAELTAAGVLGTGLWMAALGIARTVQPDMGRVDAGALLIVCLWACIAARLGIRVGGGQRHLLANVLVSAALLALYQGVVTLIA